jgi:hypothetical protein
MKLSSPQFEHTKPIPARYTCEGSDINPPLHIEDIPEQSKSVALIVDDPDAPSANPWVHWLIWNVDPKTREIREDQVPAGAQQGTNDFHKQSYGGPCPPSGTHRYFFKLYALDTKLDLKPKAVKKNLEDAMKGHIIAHAELIGLYKRAG